MHWVYTIPLLLLAIGELLTLAAVVVWLRTRPWTKGAALTWDMVTDCVDTAQAVESTTRRDPWFIRWLCAHQALLALVICRAAARRCSRLGAEDADVEELLCLGNASFWSALTLLWPGHRLWTGRVRGDVSPGWRRRVLRAVAEEEARASWGNVKGQALILWHGTGTCLLNNIRRAGLEPADLPADVRQAIVAASTVLRRHPQLGPRTRDTLAPNARGTVALTLDRRVEAEPERILRCAIAPGLPAFAYELLAAGESDDMSSLAAQERLALESAREVGERLRRDNLIVLLRVRATPALLHAWGYPPTTTDFETFMEHTMLPFLDARVARRERLAAPSLDDVATWTFGSPAERAEVRAPYVPIDEIDILTQTRRYASLREVSDSAVYAFSPRTI